MLVNVKMLLSKNVLKLVFSKYFCFILFLSFEMNTDMNTLCSHIDKCNNKSLCYKNIHSPMCVCVHVRVCGHVGLPPSLFIRPFRASLLSEVRQEQDVCVINTNVVCFYCAAEHTQEVQYNHH